MEKHALHLSLIGGGIWRLPTVAALQCQGIGVMVFERNLEMCEIGAGLTKWGSGPQQQVE